MIKIGKKSELSTSEIKEKAVAFFRSGNGMRITAQDSCCARFEGGGGYVFVEATSLDEQDGSDVTVEGREWDFQIRQFIKGI